MLLDLAQVRARGVEAGTGLVEGVVGALLEFLADELDALLPPEALVLSLDLGQPPGFAGGIGGLMAALGVAVELVARRVRRREWQDIEDVVDAG